MGNCRLFWALGLAVTLVAACQSRVVPSTQPVPLGRRTLAPSKTTTPKPTPKPQPQTTPAVPRLVQPSVEPSASASPASPIGTPSASAVVGDSPPDIAIQPLALNTLESIGLAAETENFLVVSTAFASPLPALRLTAEDAAGAYALRSLSDAARVAISRKPGDRHAAFRRMEQNITWPLASRRPYVLKQATPLEVGATRDFWVIVDFVEDRYVETSVKAEVLNVGAHCYVMVDQKALSVARDRRRFIERAQEIAETFDRGIYPTNTGLFGAEPRPGVDGDPRVFILISPAVGNNGRDTTLGYFSQRDAFAPDRRPGNPLARSNGAEIIYVSSQIVAQGAPEDYMGTIAHEFQHMINFNQKVLLGKNRTAEELWIDEGMAMYAIEATGYGLKAGGQVLATHVSQFQREPWAYSLSSWEGNPEGIGYGPVYLLMVYLADRFGQDVIQSIVTSAGLGAPNLDAVLKTKNSSLKEALHDWALANVLDSAPQNQDPRYRYRSLEMVGNNGSTRLMGFRTQRLSLPADVAEAGRPFSVRYYRLPEGVIAPRVSLTGTSPAAWRLFPRLVLPQE